MKHSNIKEKYLSVVNDFIDKLENNDQEAWHKSWKLKAGLPRNFTTEREYQGINILTLLSGEFEDSRFLTFKQIKALGGTVKAGSKSTPIFFNQVAEKEIVNEETGEMEMKSYWVFKQYNVFNITQTDGIEYEKEKPKPRATHKELQDFIDANGAKIAYGEPSYSPSTDTIKMPAVEDFESEEHFFSTMAHEYSHWTGHESRLNRLSKNARFGDDEYAIEELVAELSALFITMEFGTEKTTKNQALSYLAGWIKILKSNPKILMTVCSQASQATNYLMSEYHYKTKIRDNSEFKEVQPKTQRPLPIKKPKPKTMAPRRV